MMHLHKNCGQTEHITYGYQGHVKDVYLLCNWSLVTKHKLSDIINTLSHWCVCNQVTSYTVLITSVASSYNNDERLEIQ